jgi:hypothetical protein
LEAALSIAIFYGGGAQGCSARNVPLVLCVEYLHGDGADTTGAREEAHEEGGGRSPHDAPWRCHRRRRSALAISGYLACYGAASSADSLVAPFSSPQSMPAADGRSVAAKGRALPLARGKTWRRDRGALSPCAGLCRGIARVPSSSWRRRWVGVVLFELPRVSQRLTVSQGSGSDGQLPQETDGRRAR